MKKWVYISLTAGSLVLGSCKKIDNDYQCLPAGDAIQLDRLELLNQFDSGILEAVANGTIPDESGAIAQNLEGYFHVRFQLGVASLADYAVRAESSTYLDYAIRTMEYAFNYQLDDGNFELIVPEDLEKKDVDATDADKASGVAFFMAALGLALMDFESSPWYHLPENGQYKSRVEALRPKIEISALWLKDNKDILLGVDSDAPNRLFFDALAFYALGKWLDIQTLKDTGLEFCQLAIASKHQAGYFIEGGGWDSSYQGVALSKGFALYSIMDDTEPLKISLWQCLYCAADWQRSRVCENGKISTKDNTRVGPFGESFLGEKKKVAWLDTMYGLLIASFYSGNQEFYETAMNVKANYE